MATGAPSSTDERVLAGRYRLVSHIADGGMAAVHLAIDERLGRRVAVKILRPDLARDAAFVTRFRREAQLAAGLSHPNIVAIHDFEDSDGELFLVMEFVAGRTLRDRIGTEGALSVREAVRIWSALLDALAAAHRAGLVHRDVKPENVLLRPDGAVKVTDFGLARSVTSSTRTSTTGVLMGTISYLAPEQLDGDRADARSDVYAAGLVLYELLTGQRAFQGEHPMHVAYQHVHGSVPMASDRVATVPVQLDQLIARASAKDPADRPADAGHLQRALRETIADLDEEALGASPVFLADPAPGVSAQQSADDPVTDPLAAAAEPDTTPAVEPLASTDQATAPADRSRPSVTQRIPTEITAAVPVPVAAPVPVPPAPAAPAAPASTTGRRRWRRIAAWLLAIVVLAGGGGGWWWYDTRGPGSIRVVPSLQHLARADAESALARVQLQSAVTQVFDEVEPAGQVVSASAEAGAELPKQSTVTITVSKGPERYAVPDLRTHPRADVQRLLAERSLALGKVDEVYHDTVAEGVVISQDPPAETSVKRDTPVAVVISKGRQPIPVPNLAGKSVDEAKAALTAAGLTPVVAEAVNHDTVPAGSVISQSPTQGTLFKGDTVTVVPSKGPVLVQVPNVVGKQRAEAKAILERLGFTVSFDNVLGGFFGTVRSSNPAAGTMARQGATITLTIV